MSNLSINESNDNSNVSILLNKSGAQSSTNSSPNLIVLNNLKIYQFNYNNNNKELKKIHQKKKKKKKRWNK